MTSLNRAFRLAVGPLSGFFGKGDLPFMAPRLGVLFCCQIRLCELGFYCVGVCGCDGVSVCVCVIGTAGGAEGRNAIDFALIVFGCVAEAVNCCGSNPAMRFHCRAV